MIDSLKGTLIHKDPAYCVVECMGVGYKCYISLYTFAELTETGKEAKIFTHLIVKEDAMDLYGFYDIYERECFKTLITVPKVGAKVGLSILSSLSPLQVEIAVAAGDAKTLTVANGVGLKLAQRIVLELKGKFKMDGSAPISAGIGGVAVAAGNASSEAVAALTALGFELSEAASAVSACDQAKPVGDIVKEALKRLSGAK